MLSWLDIYIYILLCNYLAFFFKFHAEIYFDHDLQSYVLVDQGSQNGTIVNGKQILQVSVYVLINYLHNLKTDLKFFILEGSGYYTDHLLQISVQAQCLIWKGIPRKG